MTGSSLPEENPYASSYQPAESRLAEPPPPLVRPITRPLFCTVLFIVDLIFCALRIPFVVLGILGTVAAEQHTAGLKVPIELLWVETLASAAIVGLGMPANILLLMNKRVGVLLGRLALMATAISVAEGFFMAAQQISQGNHPKVMYVMVFLAFILISRVVLLGLYANALIKFSAWYRATWGLPTKSN